MPEGYITTENTGIKLHYHTWESTHGGRPMLLLHGLASTLKIWDLTAPLLAEKFSVTAYDQRGHALSDKPESGYDLATMLADLEGLIAKLDLKDPVIVGHSWGATLAAAYAAAHPDNCSGLAMLDGGVTEMKSRPGATWENISEALAPPDLSQYTMQDALNWSRSGALKDLSQQFRESYYGSMMEVMPNGHIRARLSRAHHIEILHNIWQYEPAAVLKQVKAPMLAVLALQGPMSSGDDFTRAKQRGVQMLEENGVQAKVVWMEDTIHDIPLQKPQELAQILLDFFAS